MRHGTRGVITSANPSTVNYYASINFPFLPMGLTTHRGPIALSPLPSAISARNRMGRPTPRRPHHITPARFSLARAGEASRGAPWRGVARRGAATGEAAGEARRGEAASSAPRPHTCTSRYAPAAPYLDTRIHMIPEPQL